MKKVFDVSVGIICAIACLAGVLLILGSFAGEGSDSEQMTKFFLGLSCIASCVFLYGFSIVVDAASLYIERNKKKAEWLTPLPLI